MEPEALGPRACPWEGRLWVSYLQIKCHRKAGPRAPRHAQSRPRRPKGHVLKPQKPGAPEHKRGEEHEVSPMEHYTARKKALPSQDHRMGLTDETMGRGSRKEERQRVHPDSIRTSPKAGKAGPTAPPPPLAATLAEGTKGGGAAPKRPHGATEAGEHCAPPTAARPLGRPARCPRTIGPASFPPGTRDTGHGTRCRGPREPRSQAPGRVWRPDELGRGRGPGEPAFGGHAAWTTGRCRALGCTEVQDAATGRAGT